MRKLLKKLKLTLKEFKKISWCKPKEWIQSSFVVIGVGGLMAILLTFFDYISAFLVTWIGGLF